MLPVSVDRAWTPELSIVSLTLPSHPRGGGPRSLIEHLLYAGPLLVVSFEAGPSNRGFGLILSLQVGRPRLRFSCPELQSQTPAGLRIHLGLA